MISTRARSAGLLAVLALSVGAGCGNGSQPASQASSTPARVSATPAPPSPDQAQLQRERQAERSRALKGTVRDFYRDLAGQDFETAWSRLSPELQSFLGGFNRWQQGYRDTISTSASSIALANADSHDASLAFQLRTVDLDACADRVAQRFRATWRLSKIGDRWIIAEMHTQRVAGRPPTRRFSDCPGVNPPTEPRAYVPPDEPPPDEDLPEPPRDYSEPPPSLPRRPTTQDFGQGLGRVGLCRDGTLSDSVGRSGACSYHGGVSP